MRKLLILSMLCFALVMPKAFGWDLSWYNQEQVFDQNGIPVAPGSLVQLIAVGADGVINDPYEWWMSQPDPCAAMNAWIAGGCLPVGDDYLVPSTGEPNPQYIQDFGTGDPNDGGYFLALYISGVNPPYGSTMQLYTRYFTAENPQEGDWYGILTDWYDLYGVLHTEPYVIDNLYFPNFVNPGGQVSQRIECGIIPEPASASMLLGGIGLLLAFFRRKK